MHSVVEFLWKLRKPTLSASGIFSYLKFIKISSMSSEEHLTADHCDQLCHQFAEITQTDTACGHLFLQENDWKLDVNNFIYLIFIKL